MLSFDSIDPIVDLDAGCACDEGASDVDADTAYELVYPTPEIVMSHLVGRFDMLPMQLRRLAYWMWTCNLDPNVAEDTARGIEFIGLNAADFGYDSTSRQWR